MRRFLFFYPGALGDLLLAAPVFQALREKYCDVEIDCIGSIPQVRLLLVLELVDRVYPIDDRRFLPVFGGKECPGPLLDFFRSFDAVVFWISYFHIKLTNVPLKIVSPRPDPHPPVHHAQYLYHSVRSFLNLPVQDLTSFSLKNIRGNPAKKPPALLVHPGSGSLEKNSPLEYFLVLARKWRQRTGGKVTFLFGPADAEVLQDFQTQVPASEFSVSNSPDFGNLVNLMAATDVYLGNDSGISHLAGVFNKKGLVFFRVTYPKIWRPLGERLHPVQIG